MRMGRWFVARVVRDEIVPVGVIVRDEGGTAAFIYSPIYFEGPHAIELSCSLPLGPEVFPEVQFRPYFEGLLPEGEPRRVVAELNGVREEDYLSLLGIVGHDCIGDVVIYEHDIEDERDPNVQDEETRALISKASYRPVTTDEIAEMLSDLTAAAEATSQSRLSLAGSQRKIGLAHPPGEPMDRGWFQPDGRAASSHILKVGTTARYAQLELVCMGAAPAMGIATADTSGLWLSQPVVASERFDREILVRDPETPKDPGGMDRANIEPPIVYRLHQEDMSQAFGYASGSKYAEVRGGSYRAIAHLLREHSISAAEDLEQLARIAVFNYLVGNCDNHLKNLSVMHVGRRGLKLAPAYDILCTTIFESEQGVPKWRREMGMRLGSAHVIDDVAAGDFDLLAEDIGIGRRAMMRICREMGEGVADALVKAGERFAYVSDAIPYDAEDLVEEMTPRLAVVHSVR